jgi:hypothetical protein
MQGEERGIGGLRRQHGSGHGARDGVQATDVNSFAARTGVRADVYQTLTRLRGRRGGFQALGDAVGQIDGESETYDRVKGPRHEPEDKRVLRTNRQESEAVSLRKSLAPLLPRARTTVRVAYCTRTRARAYGELVVPPP